MNITSQENEKQQLIKFDATITPDEIKPLREKAAVKLAGNLKLEGFRKGKAPLKLLLQHLKESELNAETIQFILLSALKQALTDNKITEFIGNPQFDFDVNKFNPEQDFSFSFIIYKKPAVSLGDYASLKLSPKNPDVTEKDLQEEREKFEKFLQQLQEQSEKKEGIIGSRKLTFEELLKKFTAMKSMEEFEENSHKAIWNRKIRENLNSFTTKVIDETLKISEIKLPEILINLELSEIVEKIRLDLKSYKSTLEDYLKEKKITIEDFRKEQLPHAEKIAQTKVLLDSIAEKENIKVEENEIENEKKIILSQYIDGNQKLTDDGKEISKKLATPEGKNYLSNNIRRDKVITTLLKKFVPDDYGKIPEGRIVKKTPESGKIILPNQA